MRRRKRIEGLTGKRLCIAVMAIFLLTVVSRENALIGGIVVVAIIAAFAFMKFRRTDYLKHFDTQEELCEAFCGNRNAFAHFVSNVFGKIDYIVEMAPANVKTSVDMKLWKEGREYLVLVDVKEKGMEIDEEQIRSLHLDMVECDCDGGFLVTTGAFDSERAEYAQQFDITLVDTKILFDYISK